ncbi:alpha-galactosidase [Faecalibaculum rodentium]|uniref:alpha-galactosidase n=1 Tax=Faecalibaculum rodentium TaxID=1702221 RepID=UPI0026F3F18C|nr:alpha-galactosidase [Faecalibaculum rodentium]
MPISFKQTSMTFHLYNRELSYIIKILPEGIPVQLYFGAALPDRDDWDYLLEFAARPMSVNYSLNRTDMSLEHLRLEYPMSLSGDMRNGAADIRQKDGSRIAEFVYESHEIRDGKPSLEPLPACYVESADEACTLDLRLWDEKIQSRLVLSYTIYENRPVICRNARIENLGSEGYILDRMMSLSLDLPDDDWEQMVLAGAWARERNIEVHPLHTGVQSIYSLRGHSSHNYNPFLCLKRRETTEQSGECFGLSLVYSGNFLAETDVNTYHTTRVSMGIHPYTFSWPLQPGESFQTPEAVLVYAQKGLNAMSQAFHGLFRERLARGRFRDEPRPLLLNSWEGIYMNVDEVRVLEMAQATADLGLEMFVLDDGWFKGRDSDATSLGDWVTDSRKLPSGLGSLSRKVEDMGIQFGLWFEPEMISMDSDLYRSHPDWLMHTPGRRISTGRKQFVLDFANLEVVTYIGDAMEKILDEASISYIKWDMNRSLSEVYSLHYPADQQGTIYHRFILGVYALYDRLTKAHPEILFESCASGGARFDPGMLYYAPQTWTSDDTDAVERLKIQYGTSMLYPISSMGSHVSAIPNHQLHRLTSLHMRFAVAIFGTFGYELDPLALTEDEKEEIRDQVRFMKKYRQLIQFGTFYRLQSPFAGTETAWMVVSEDKKQAIVGYYRVLQEINAPFRRLKLQGLSPDRLYAISGKEEQEYGIELERAGLVLTDASASENRDGRNEGDYLARLFVLKAVD